LDPLLTAANRLVLSNANYPQRAAVDCRACTSRTPSRMRTCSTFTTPPRNLRQRRCLPVADFAVQALITHRLGEIFPPEGESQSGVCGPERRRHPGCRAYLARHLMHYDLGYFDDETCLCPSSRQSGSNPLLDSGLGKSAHRVSSGFPGPGRPLTISASPESFLMASWPCSGGGQRRP
jgi:hypothetical protein